MAKCPVCGTGTLRKGKVEETMFGIVIGKFPGEICSNCNETFLDEETMKKVEKKAKEIGIWGISKKIKIVRSGNSLSIRIPAK